MRPPPPWSFPPFTVSVCCRLPQELEMLSEVPEASACLEEEVKQLQTRPRYWSRGEKLTLGKSDSAFSADSLLWPFVTSCPPQRIS